MRYFCVADEQEVLTGMRLAGITGTLATAPREVEAAVAAVRADANVAVLLVTEACYAMCPELLGELKLSAERPLVCAIPGSRGSSRAPDYITRLINEAIGVKI